MPPPPPTCPWLVLILQYPILGIVIYCVHVAVNIDKTFNKNIEYIYCYGIPRPTCYTIDSLVTYLIIFYGKIGLEYDFPLNFTNC